ncbi:MAG TPA: hypothetical protein PKY59_05580 [Pyrinomonadaceae bacterium]|nr:hypothetical protein [Pyrinomonadaceae bacterium]
MAIDRMDWHYGNDFPDDLPEENGGTHIGIYLAWIINNNLQGELHNDESAEALQKIKNREITGRDFLIEECDEKFWDEDLNEEGLAFTEFYYCEIYFEDYAEVLENDLPSIYHAENTWENYDKVALVIDRRFKEWKGKNS